MPLTVSVSAPAFQRVRREPELPVPRTNAVARLVLAELERKHGSPDGTTSLALFVRRPAAPSRRTRSAAPGAPDRAPRSPGSSGTSRSAFSTCQPRLIVADAAQRGDQVVFDDPFRCPRRASPATRCRRTDRSSACLAGFQIASAPQAGQANFCCAVSSDACGWVSAITAARARCVPKHKSSHESGVQELIDCGPGDAPLRTDLLALQSRPAARLARTSDSATPSSCAT